MTAPLLMELTGVLVEDGQSRFLPADQQGHVQPMLCLQVEVDGPTCTTFRLRQVFAADAGAQCAAAARRFKRGQRVRFQVPVGGLVVSAVAEHIHTIPEPAKEPQPC